MLRSFTIENYALIERLELNPEAGLNMITGETGAGKSILLGALSLLLGARADTSVLKYPDKPCVLEGLFEIDRPDMKDWFESNELDPDKEILVRRMIMPAGKSRAFMNDVPVALNLLKEFGDRMLDIHSQHKNLLLQSGDFQLSVLDAMARTKDELSNYQEFYRQYKNKFAELSRIRDLSARNASELDYLRFQLQQLEDAKLISGEQEALEQEQHLLEHAEEILASMGKMNALLEAEDTGVVRMLKEATHEAERMISNYPEAENWKERLHSAYIDLQDLQSELDRKMEGVDMDPARLGYVQERLDVIYSLQKKHQVPDTDALIQVRERLSEQVSEYDLSSFHLEKLEKELSLLQKECYAAADLLSSKRAMIVPELESQVTALLKHLGMPHAMFKVRLEKMKDFAHKGTDEVEFLFSANSGISPKNIEGIASGGEMARLMLTLKYIMVGQGNLPTILFDEIDTGVSGEVADAMGSMIERMSTRVQVINITHLPQVAAKGQAHFLVYKDNSSGVAASKIKKLDAQERVEELAKMLSGKIVTDAARDQASQLLNP